jgi:hypothetical protein
VRTLARSILQSRWSGRFKITYGQPLIHVRRSRPPPYKEPIMEGFSRWSSSRSCSSGPRSAVTTGRSLCARPEFRARPGRRARPCACRKPGSCGHYAPSGRRRFESRATRSPSTPRSRPLPGPSWSDWLWKVTNSVSLFMSGHGFLVDRSRSAGRLVATLLHGCRGAR